MKTDQFDYDLSQDYIAQSPAEPRDHCRLMVLHRKSGRIEHRRFFGIADYLKRPDLLVANDSRVIPARLHGRKETGGKVEIFLLAQRDDNGCEWECLVRGRNLVTGVQVKLGSVHGSAGKHSPDMVVAGGPLMAEIIAVHANGTRLVRFNRSIRPILDEVGEIPLPPYITDYSGDMERYQTIYSRREGSVAAPTAGLHFTPELLVDLRRQGIGWETVTLHIGLDTFQPVTSDRIEDHEIHTEWAEMTAETARCVNETSHAGGRIVGVGTTSVRTLEWAATGAQGIKPYNSDDGDTDAAADAPRKRPRVAAFRGPVDLYIRPGYRMRAVDALVTNFHLPRSSLLMLVSAFVGHVHGDDVDAGRRILLDAYETAKQEGYRFFSFGDAMLIL